VTFSVDKKQQKSSYDSSLILAGGISGPWQQVRTILHQIGIGTTAKCSAQLLALLV